MTVSFPIRKIAFILICTIWAAHRPASAQEVAPEEAGRSPCELACRAREVECRARCAELAGTDTAPTRDTSPPDACSGDCDIDSIDCYDQCVAPVR